MGFLDDFTGKSRQQDLSRAYTDATGFLNRGYDDATAAYDRAGGLLDPYAESGGRANAMLMDALGVNGQPAYQSIVDNYTRDPFRQSNEDFANKQLLTTFNRYLGGPGANSGNAMLAAARGSLERGSTDWNNWLNRLTGAGDRGYQATTAQAGIQTGLGDLAQGHGQTLAGNRINYGNAMADSRGTLTNNLLGVGGLAVGAFTPGKSGQSAVGNAMKLFG